MTYPQSTPYPPSVLDNVAYAQTLADSIMRNNPLVNAIVPKGLMKWYGNYQNPDSTPVNFLWIGEFFPSDPNLGNIPQKGFSLVRDDPSHSSAIAMFDRSPGASSPLKQTISVYSYDTFPMLDESRAAGGISFPRYQIPMNTVDGFFASFPKCTSTSVTAVSEGRWSGIGTTMHYRLWGVTDAGVTGQIRIHSVDGALDAPGPWHILTAGSNLVFDNTIDVTAFRGHKEIDIYVEAQITGGAGNLYCQIIALTNYSV